MTLEKQRSLIPHWLTERFTRSQSGENPAVENVTIVRDGFYQLLQQAHVLVSNGDFQVGLPVRLVTKKSGKLEGTLQYDLGKSIRNDQTHHTATVQILDRKTTKWLSRTIWDLKTTEDDYLGRYLEITADSDTRREWEGNRFGTSLVLLSNDVINHLLHHLTQYNHLSVKATIIDAAYGHIFGFKNREGWTSKFATELDYSPAARDEFVKWYR